MFRLDGKVSIVTGASRGLGYGMASALADAGSTVILVGRHKESIVSAADKLSSEGNNILPIVADVTSKKDCGYLVDQVLGSCNTIDILVNNAGINIRKPFLELTKRDFEKVIATNLAAPFFLTQKVGTVMIQKGCGKIINVASLSSKIGIADISAYAASKGGIASLTKSLSVEFAKHNININAVAPGYYETVLTKDAFEDDYRKDWILSRIPMGRSGNPSDLGGTVVFLASEASDYITGQIIYVDGGWTAA